MVTQRISDWLKIGPMLVLMLMLVCAYSFPFSVYAETHDSADYEEEEEEFPYEEIEVDSLGRQVIYAKLYEPAQLSEEEEVDSSIQYPLIILYHHLGGNHRDWRELPETLTKKGYAVLAVDLRGHGNSSYIRGHGRKNWRRMGAPEWDKMPSDTRFLLKYFNEDQETYPQIDTTNVVIMGAGIGANAAILSARRNNDVVQGLVALSPGLDYKGIKTVKSPVGEFKHPSFYAASQDDTVAFEATKILHKLASSPKSLRLYRRIGHGTDMLRFHPPLQEDILKWLKHYIKPGPYPTKLEFEDEENDSSH